MKKLIKGVLVSVEGIDGCGKSTLVSHLTQTLHHELPVCVTREPGGTELGKQLRNIVQQQPHPLDPQTEFLLFAADRAQHFHEIIIPALAEHKMVISDRLADSSVVYQGYARGLDLTIINQVNNWVMHGVVPDLVIFVQVTPKVAFQRLIQRKTLLTAFERETQDFMQRVLDGYTQHLSTKKNVVYLDGTLDQQQLTQQAINAINTWLKQQNYYA